MQIGIVFAWGRRYFFFVHRFHRLLIFVLALAATVPAVGATGKVKKVLPHFVDQQGRHTLSPSLYERDAYQVFLRDTPAERAGMRFDVNYKTSGAALAPLRLQLELRGAAVGRLPDTVTLEREVPRSRGWFSKWSRVMLTGQAYRDLGNVTAWRVTLWEGDTLLGEQKSFLW